MRTQLSSARNARARWLSDGLDKAIVILRTPELEMASPEGRPFIRKVSMDRNAPTSAERFRRTFADVNVL